MIRPITFDKQFVKSQDDAHIRNTLLSGGIGISKGCEMTYTSEHITISSGYFCAFGRWVAIEGEEVIEIGAMTQSPTVRCALVYTIDLTQANTDEEFLQGKFEILKNSNRYPPLRQEDLDNGGEVYQLEFARFSQALNGIHLFMHTIGSIIPSIPIATQYRQPIISPIPLPPSWGEIKLTQDYIIDSEDSITLFARLETPYTGGGDYLSFKDAGFRLQDTPTTFMLPCLPQPGASQVLAMRRFHIRNNFLASALTETIPAGTIFINGLQLLKEKSHD